MGLDSPDATTLIHVGPCRTKGTPQLDMYLEGNHVLLPLCVCYSLGYGGAGSHDFTSLG